MSSSFNASSSSSGSGVTLSMEEIKKIFAKFDANRDGFISGEELVEVFVSMKSEINPEEVKTLMSELDKDGDGKINLDEFAEIFKESTSTKELREAFDIYDLDKNGLISVNELHEVLNRLLGQKSSLEQCAAMIAKVDEDGDGFVSFEEFKKMMNRS